MTTRADLLVFWSQAHAEKVASLSARAAGAVTMGQFLAHQNHEQLEKEAGLASGIKTMASEVATGLKSLGRAKPALNAIPEAMQGMKNNRLINRIPVGQSVANTRVVPTLAPRPLATTVAQRPAVPLTNVSSPTALGPTLTPEGQVPRRRIPFQRNEQTFRPETSERYESAVRAAQAEPAAPIPQATPSPYAGSFGYMSRRAMQTPGYQVHLGASKKNDLLLSIMAMQKEAGKFGEIVEGVGNLVKRVGRSGKPIAKAVDTAEDAVRAATNNRRAASMALNAPRSATGNVLPHPVTSGPPTLNQRMVQPIPKTVMQPARVVPGSAVPAAGTQSIPGGTPAVVASRAAQGTQSIPGGTAAASTSRAAQGTQAIPGGTAAASASRAAQGTQAIPGGTAAAVSNRAAQGTQVIPGGTASVHGRVQPWSEGPGIPEGGGYRSVSATGPQPAVPAPPSSPPPAPTPRMQLGPQDYAPAGAVPSGEIRNADVRTGQVLDAGGNPSDLNQAKKFPWLRAMGLAGMIGVPLAVSTAGTAALNTAGKFLERPAGPYQYGMSNPVYGMTNQSWG
jgi:hypothetical protein